MGIFEKMEQHGYEQVVFCYDRPSKLKAIIAIHDTTLGPSLGGCRMWPYKSEDEALTEAARDCGATPWQAFRYVTLPLIMPGVIAGALMAFTLSIDDFVITFFTAGAGTTTLPLQIYSMIKIAVTPEVNAVSTLLMLLTLLLIVVATKVSPTLFRTDPGATE